MDPPAGIPLNSYHAIGNQDIPNPKIIFERDNYSGGIIGYLIYLPNEETVDNYSLSMTKIKGTVRDFRLSLVNGVIDQAVFNERMLDVWIPMVMDFIAMFGLEYVPPDIRSTLNNVQRNLGLDITVFEQDDIVPLNWG